MRPVSVTLSTDTSAYANGDLIADTQIVSAALDIDDGIGSIRAIQVFDTDDQTAYTFWLVFHRTSTSMGTENSAPNISDANAVAGIMGSVAFATTDAFDYGGGKHYFKGGLAIPIQAATGGDDIYISMVCITGTPTHSAAGITVKLWIDPRAHP